MFFTFLFFFHIAWAAICEYRNTKKPPLFTKGRSESLQFRVTTFFHKLLTQPASGSTGILPILLPYNGRPRCSLLNICSPTEKGSAPLSTVLVKFVRCTAPGCIHSTPSTHLSSPGNFLCGRFRLLLLPFIAFSWSHCFFMKSLFFINVTAMGNIILWELLLVKMIFSAIERSFKNKNHK